MTIEKRRFSQNVVGVNHKKLFQEKYRQIHATMILDAEESKVGDQLAVHNEELKCLNEILDNCQK